MGRKRGRRVGEGAWGTSALSRRSFISSPLWTPQADGPLDPRDPPLQSERTQGFTADPVYGIAKCLPMVGEIKTYVIKDLKDITSIKILSCGGSEPRKCGRTYVCCSLLTPTSLPLEIFSRETRSETREAFLEKEGPRLETKWTE